MSLVDSPDAGYTSTGKPPERRQLRRRLLRLIIILLLVVGIGVNLYGFFASDGVEVLTRTNGFVTGVVVDEEDRPVIDALIFVAAAPDITTNTDATGRFTLENIPPGEQYLVVVGHDVGQGYVVTVGTESAADVGTLVYDALPAVWK